MSDFKCPICLREIEHKATPKKIQLWGKGNEYVVCDTCADVVVMLRAGLPEDSEIIPVRVSIFDKALLARFAPFFGNSDAEVLKNLAKQWIEKNIGSPSIVLLCEMNQKIKEEIERTKKGRKE